MPLNPDAVGATGDPRNISWSSKDALLYAVGIGAGQADLPFTTENTQHVAQVVFPTFAVVAGSGSASPGASAMSKIGSFNFALLVHGSQAITLHRPIPVEAQATTQDKVVAMYDKGKAAVVVTESVATDNSDGQPLFTNRSSVFIRGEGGWGGDRGPSGPQNVPPERAPDHSVTYQTSPDQALVYRLSGDRNPLHSDPAFAAMGGYGSIRKWRKTSPPLSEPDLQHLSMHGRDRMAQMIFDALMVRYDAYNQRNAAAAR